jgi:two-component system OmpR family sensor kinase
MTVRLKRGEAWRIATWTERLETETDAAEKKSGRAEASVGLVIQCAESLSPTAHELGELASLLALVSLAAFLIAGGGSFWLAGRALRPIRRIDAALEEVSETRLDRRLDPSSFDIELHPLITRLNAALERLEKGFQRERQFTADASHELRTPLTALLSSIEVLLRRPRSEAELIEAHRDNEKTARSMQAVVEGLLLLARMDSGKVTPAKESISPAALVEDIFATIGARAAAKTVALGHSVAPSLRVRADPAQLRLALLNLIDNAVRYNRPGGSVSVGARRTGETTAIEVRDTGLGIPQDQLSRIFERFYRVDPSRAETTGGCGLGLSIVRKIIEGHGGRVGVSSGPDGSVFTIVLPDA